MAQEDKQISIFIDLLETGIHKYGDDVIDWVFDIVPKGWKNKLAQNTFFKELASKGALAGALAASRVIPNTPWWSLLDTSIKFMAGKVSDRIDELKVGGQEVTLENLQKSPQVQTAVQVFQGAFRLGHLELDREGANNIALWITYLKETMGIDWAQKGLLMTSQMPLSKLAMFAEQDWEEMTAHLEADDYTPPVPFSELVVADGEEEEPGFFERQRDSFRRIFTVLDRKIEERKHPSPESFLISQSRTDSNLTQAISIWREACEEISSEWDDVRIRDAFLFRRQKKQADQEYEPENEEDEIPVIDSSLMNWFK
ncbi:hypothetical protein ACFL29_01765 [Patescibacteria group bacterium]